MLERECQRKPHRIINSLLYAWSGKNTKTNSKPPELVPTLGMLKSAFPHG